MSKALSATQGAKKKGMSEDLLPAQEEVNRLSRKPVVHREQKQGDFKPWIFLGLDISRHGLCASLEEYLRMFVLPWKLYDSAYHRLGNFFRDMFCVKQIIRLLSSLRKKPKEHNRSGGKYKICVVF